MNTIGVCFLIAVVCALASAAPAPQYSEIEEKGHKKHIPIIKSLYEQHHEGYKYSYDTGNGIHAEEAGYIKNKGDKEHETIVKKGTITYLDEHGHPYTLSYIADETGFHPIGDHLPTQPSVEGHGHHEVEQHHAPHEYEHQQYSEYK